MAKFANRPTTQRNPAGAVPSMMAASPGPSESSSVNKHLRFLQKDLCSSAVARSGMILPFINYKEPSNARADLRVSRTGCVQRGDERHCSERSLPETLDHSRQVDRTARRFTCAPVDRRGYLP